MAGSVAILLEPPQIRYIGRMRLPGPHAEGNCIIVTVILSEGEESKIHPTNRLSDPKLACGERF